MKLIVNADDFGYSRAVNFGIIDCHRFGVVRSATVMANMPALAHAAELAAAHPGLGVGVHLVLTAGRALTGHPALSDAQGYFFPQGEFDRRLRQGEMDLDAVEREWDAQIQAALDVGLHLTHIDSHHHKHMEETLLPICLKKAQKYHLAVRLPSAGNVAWQGEKSIRTTAAFSDQFYGKAIAVEDLLSILQSHQDKESLELMCHPAYLDADLIQGSSYNTARTQEYQTLTAPALWAYIAQKEIELVNYATLSC